jgi:hypothetical protein
MAKASTNIPCSDFKSCVFPRMGFEKIVAIEMMVLITRWVVEYTRWHEDIKLWVLGLKKSDNKN